MAVATVGINLVGRKTCSKCEVEKPYGDFHRRSNRKRGLASACKVCERARGANKTVESKRALYERHREKYLAYYRQKSYGISAEQYEEMVERQHGVCAICGEAETAKNKRGEIRQLAVDHSHETGRVRGLLCAACNIALGHMRDDPQRLKAAARYLERSS